jgi:glycosyltransferase involved in cell wall biosynthesis
VSPLVSIVIPVMNGMPYIKEAVSSALNSLMTEIEVIISDNASDDGTSEYLQSLKDPRVIVLTQTQRVSAAENWNRVTAAAKGEYIKLLCADDTISADCLNNQVAAMTSHSNVVLVASKRRVVNDNGKTVLNRHGLLFLSGKIEGKRAIRNSVVTGTNQFGEPASVLFKRNVLFFCLPWDSKEPYVTDLDMYSKVLMHGDFIGLKTTDATFRLTKNSWSQTIGDKQSKQFNEWLSNYYLSKESEINKLWVSIGFISSKIVKRLRAIF